MRIFYSTADFHPVNQELIKNPPVDVEYIHTKFLSRIYLPSEDTRSYRIKNRLHITVEYGYSVKKRIYKKLGVPVNTSGVPFSCDLIHSSGNLILNRKNWVVDFEHPGKFTDFSNMTFERDKNIITRYLSSRHCKKILPWSYACKRVLETYFHDPEIVKKTEIVYPARSAEISRIESKEKNEGRVRLLFIGYSFLAKGGRELLRSFEILDKKYDVELVVISNVPNEIQNRYAKYTNILFKNFYALYDKRAQHVFKEYPKADILVMPTYFDSFGMVFLEAMAYSLPLVSTDVYAIPEIVEDGVNGLLVHTLFSNTDNLYSLDRDAKWMAFLNSDPKKFIKELSEKLSVLIEDSSLRKKMGRNGRKEITDGRFSIKERNKKLKRIYEEALR